MKRKALLEVLNTLLLEDLKWICEKLELKKTGTKQELIERILKKVGKVDPNFLRGLLRETLAPYKKEVLLELLENFGLEVRKTEKESDIIERLLDFVMEGSQPERRKIIPKEILKRLSNELFKIELVGKIRDHSSLKIALLNSLKSKRKIRIIEEVPQKSLDIKDIGVNISIADILVRYEDYDIPIELKYIKGRNISEILKGLGQSLIYRKIYGGAILLIYDASKSLSDRPKNREFEKGIWVVIR